MNYRYACAAIALTSGIGHAAEPSVSAAPASTHTGIYVFCYEGRRSPATSYLSGTFEVPRVDIDKGANVIFSEFAQDTAQRYGVAVAVWDPRSRNDSCVYQNGLAAADAMRKTYAAAFAKRSAVVETGWKFVRTAQTPLPVLSPYTDH
jgi:hypothetical protein